MLRLDLDVFFLGTAMTAKRKILYNLSIVLQKLKKQKIFPSSNSVCVVLA
jgi:hypothetical protein